MVSLSRIDEQNKKSIKQKSVNFSSTLTGKQQSLNKKKAKAWALKRIRIPAAILGIDDMESRDLRAGSPKNHFC